MDRTIDISGFDPYANLQRGSHSSERRASPPSKIKREDVNFANKLVSKAEINSKEMPAIDRQEGTRSSPELNRKITKVYYPPKMTSESLGGNNSGINGLSDIESLVEQPFRVKIRTIKENIKTRYNCSIDESKISKIIDDLKLENKDVNEAAALSETGKGILDFIYTIWSTSSDGNQSTRENGKTESYFCREEAAYNVKPYKASVSAIGSFNAADDNVDFPSLLLFGSGYLEEGVEPGEMENSEDLAAQGNSRHTPHFLTAAENPDRIKQQLMADKIIGSDGEFDFILKLLRDKYGIKVWVRFSEEYNHLAKLNGMLSELKEKSRCADIEFFTHENLFDIYFSGIYSFYLDDIQEADTLDQAETIILAIYNDVRAMDQQFDSVMPDDKNLELRDFPLKNFGNTCWFNSSLNFMLDCFNKQTMEALELKEFTDSDAVTLSLKMALRDTLGTLCKIREHQRKHKRIFSVLGYQKKLMRCFHQMGLKDSVKYGALSTIFDQEIPGMQRDASQFLVGFMDVLELNDDPSFSIQSQAYVTTTLKDKYGNSHKLSRPSGGQESFQPMNLPIARNPGWFEMAAMVITPEDLNRLMNASMGDAKAYELLTCFNLLNSAVCPERDKKTDEGLVRKRVNRLNDCLLKQLNGVVQPDAIVINQERVLQQQCLLRDGSEIPKGTKLPEPGNKAELFPYIDSQGKVASGTIVKADSGELLIMYDLGGGEQYVRGVAEVDSKGFLASPYLRKPTLVTGSFSPFPARTLEKESRILAYDGTDFGPDDTPGKPVIIDPVLTELQTMNELENMSGEQKVKYATALLRTLGLKDEAIDQKQLERLSAPVTFKESLDRFHQKEADYYSWTKEDIQTCSKHKVRCNKGKTEFKLQGTRHQALMANVAKLSRFSISLAMFESGSGSEKKRAKDATNAFLSGACPRISLPVVDSASGNTVEVQGRLRSLVCHKGSATSGHYIHLSLADKDGEVVIHDDDVSVGWSEYLKKRNLDVNQSLEDFIRDSGFTPYVALYERTFPERSP